jgi:hypothetical protein
MSRRNRTRKGRILLVTLRPQEMDEHKSSGFIFTPLKIWEDEKFRKGATRLLETRCVIKSGCLHKCFM